MVLGPVGQIFPLSYRAGINFVIFIITLKSIILLWVQTAIMLHALMLKSSSTNTCILSDKEVMTFISLKCSFKCTLDY